MSDPEPAPDPDGTGSPEGTAMPDGTAVSDGSGSAGRTTRGGNAAPAPPDAAAPVGSGMAREALARAREAAAARRREHDGAAAARRRASTRAANTAPRPASDDPVGFGAAIDELLTDRGWSAEATVASVTANWEQTVGAELAAHCRPLGLAAGVLTVEAESTAWATQIRLLQRQLLERVSAVAGTDVVRRLVVQGPTGPSWQHGRLRVRGRGPRDTYG